MISNFYIILALRPALSLTGTDEQCSFARRDKYPVLDAVSNTGSNKTIADVF
jgi:hypothetical protein